MSNQKHDHLLTDTSYQRLRELQADIFDKIELTPSLRKLINALITDKNLQTLRTEILNTLSD
jgi:hypothetical protein